MKIMLEIPDYTPEEGLRYEWAAGFTISTTRSATDFIIKANKAGLISLAIQLLTLAQDGVSAGSHFHYDELNGTLEKESAELIVEKTY